MITSVLWGGLGNQLFQIAAGFAHSKRMNTDYALNYNYSLNNKYVGQGFSPEKYKDNLYSKISETDKKEHSFLPFRQSGFRYKRIPNSDNLILRGYFQSEKFFENFYKEVKELFFFPPELKKKINKKMSFSSKRKVGVHIRRGDYKLEKNSIVHPMLSVNYYLKAMQIFSTDCVDFLIFTDDFESINKEFDLSQFTNLNNENELEDLYSLSQCDGIIMSNSSFAWWGTYLGKNKYKVVSPSIWFNPSSPDLITTDLYKDEWIKI